YSGETLLLRSTRKMSLTPAGERHLAVWRDVLTKLRQSLPSDSNRALEGEIVLTAPELFGRLKVMPILEAFIRQHTRIAARVLLLNRYVNLVGEGVDLAVRLDPLPDSSLSAVRVGEVGTLLCASPEYLEKAGSPSTPLDLVRHECIGLNAAGDGELWSFGAANGQRKLARSVRVPTRLSVNSAAASLDAALRGGGIIQARSYQVADHVAAGRLVRLLPEYESPPSPVHLVFPPNRARNGAVRALIDHAVPALKRELHALGAMTPLPGAGS